MLAFSEQLCGTKAEYNIQCIKQRNTKYKAWNELNNSGHRTDRHKQPSVSKLSSKSHEWDYGKVCTFQRYL